MYTAWYEVIVLRKDFIMHQYIITVVLVALGAIGYYSFYVNKSEQVCQKGTIIILNGASASGKSTIQREFTNISRELWLKIGIDNFFVGLLPEKFIIGPLPEDLNPEEVVMKGIPSTDGRGQLFTLIVGPTGQKVIAGMHRAIEAYTSQGNNVIVDYIAYENAWLKDLARVLKDYNVYLIGVDIPLDVLEQREKARATSPVGHARSHYDTVHAHGVYDIRVDTSKQSAAECAQAIKDFIASNPRPKAFKKLVG